MLKLVCNGGTLHYRRSDNTLVWSRRSELSAIPPEQKDYYGFRVATRGLDFALSAIA